MLQVLFCYACDCANSGPFLKVIKDNEVGVVAVIKVKEFTHYTANRHDTTIKVPTTMEVEVLTHYKGKDVRKLLTVHGNSGSTCLENLTEFRPGERYLMALIKVKPTSRKEGEKNEDYLLSICGTYWLSIKPGHLVTGNIDGSNASMSLKEVSKSITSTISPS